MKMIVRISPSKQRAWRMLEHIFGQGDYQAERNIVNRLGIGAYRLEAGYPMRDAKHDAGLLLARHHGKGKEARHLIFSGEEMPHATETEYQHAIAAVVAAAVDFAENEAPGHDYIIQAHMDRHHPHCHCIMSASNAERCIDWKPADLVRFQGLEFLNPETREKYNLISGRGRGRRPVDVGRISYASAVNNEFHTTTERAVAERLDYARVLQAIEAGELAVSRRTKAGKPLSVVLDGRVVRLSTLRKASAASATAPPADPGTAQSPGIAGRRSRGRPQRRARGPVRGR